MTFKGKVANGVVVLDDPKALPEGSVVKVEAVPETESDTDKQQLDDLRQTLLRWAGTAKGLPPDLARNHDHYLHGRPRK
jgi:hypothetical protein